jgi:ABC-type cobalamin/Fe3+-siderophores transport system ATPase subunit
VLAILLNLHTLRLARLSAERVVLLRNGTVHAETAAPRWVSAEEMLLLHHLEATAALLMKRRQWLV